MALTDNLRAQVFARDKAICAFSGASVWMLDYGMAGWANYDWADHIRPASRGGRDAVDNLVCASEFHNGKKLDNGRDCAYLFQNGRPTSYFFWNCSVLSTDQAKLLRSHSQIEATDWFFNRALANLYVGMWNEYVGTRRKRTPAYWRRSAARHLWDWQKQGGVCNFRKRGLVTSLARQM